MNPELVDLMETIEDTATALELRAISNELGKQAEARYEAEKIKKKQRG